MKKTLLAVIASILFASVALADGFSITANLQFVPQTGVLGGLFNTPYRSYRATALNYTTNLDNNVVVGASLRPGYFGGQFALSSRVGGVVVAKLNESDTGYVEGAIRLGSNQYFLPGTFGFDFDLGGEIFLTQRISDAVALYGGTGITVTLTPSPFVVSTGLNAYAGSKLELTRDLDAYLEGGILYPFGGNLGYDLTTSLYYTVMRGARVGVYGGYVNQSGLSGGFKVGISGEWTEKPETLGTPGNYLP